jgi:hypothetical protein
VATNDVEDLDLDELDDELTGQLDGEDLEPRERHTLSEIRAALRRTKGKLERAFEDGKAAGRDEEQREQAWNASGLPPAVRALMADVDPRDTDALTRKAEQLRAGGLRWGDEAADIAARVEEDARAATLTRMSSLAAGGSVVDAEDDKLTKIKARIDTHQGVSDDELAWFLERVGGAAEQITDAKLKGF